LALGGKPDIIQSGLYDILSTAEEHEHDLTNSDPGSRLEPSFRRCAHPRGAAFPPLAARYCGTAAHHRPVVAAAAAPALDRAHARHGPVRAACARQIGRAS